MSLELRVNHPILPPAPGETCRPGFIPPNSCGHTGVEMSELVIKFVIDKFDKFKYD